MQHLGPHRTFVDPHDTRGIGGVVRHTPVPRRSENLQGTKNMLCPKDPAFLERIANVSASEGPPSRVPIVMGALALTGSLVLLILPWVAGPIRRFHDEAQKRWEKTFPGISEHTGGLFDSMAFMLVLGLLASVHLCGIFSHIHSKGGVNMGAWAILGLYAGLFVNLILLHWLA